MAHVKREVIKIKKNLCIAILLPGKNTILGDKMSMDFGLLNYH